VSSAWFGISAGGRRYFGEILRTGLTLAHEAHMAAMRIEMDAERRLELIGQLAKGEDWDAIVTIGEAILDHHYPASVFDGSSGDPGPLYVVALREALARVR
jgi:hypothetical protein